MSSITTINSGDNITNSRAVINNNFEALNNDKIETSVIDTDTTLAANSDTKIPSQKAIKAYVDGGGNPATVAALAGGGYLGTPSAGNKFLTEQSRAVLRTYEVLGSPHTWTKPAGLKRIRVQIWGGGGSGAAHISANTFNTSTGGSGGNYKEATFEAADLGATVTVTVGAGGAALSRTTFGASSGNNGANTTFGSLLTAYGGAGGTFSTSVTVARISGANSFAIGGGLPDGGTDTQPHGTTGGGASSAGNSGLLAPGRAVYGGGGGGGAYNTNGGGSTSNAGGVSELGGNGGAGAAADSGTVTATAGAVPAGGGGGAGARATVATVTSGAGGAGRCLVTEYYV